MDPITTNSSFIYLCSWTLGGATKMASSEFNKGWNTLVPQQQSFVITIEATVTESNSHQGMLYLIFNVNNNILKY